MSQKIFQFEDRNIDCKYFYFFTSKKAFHGVLHKTKNDNEYSCNDNVLKPIFNKENILIDFLIRKKKKKILFSSLKRKNYKFYYSEFCTLEYKREVAKEKKRQKEINIALIELSQKYNTKKIIIVNKNGFKKAIGLLDSFFVGTTLNMNVGDKIYKANFFKVEKNLLFKLCLKDKMFFFSLCKINDSILGIKNPNPENRFIYRNSDVCKFVFRYREIIKKIYKSRK